MAIPFLNNINLSDNELQNAKLHITGTAPSAEAGQIYYNSTANTTRYHNDTEWVSIIELVPTNSTFINLVKGTGSKASLTASLSATGTADDTVYLRGDNTWSPINAIPGTYTWTLNADTGGEEIVSGTQVNLYGGVDISTSWNQTSNTLTINHDTTTRTNTTSTDTPAYGGTFEAVTSVTTNAQGHVTAIDVSTVTIPASDNTDINVNTTNLKARLAELTGDVTITGDTIIIPGDLQVTGTTTTNNVETVSTSNGVIFEGNAADENEVTLLAQTVTADRTIVLPDNSGTVALTSDLDTAITDRQYTALVGGATSIDINAVTHGLGADSSSFLIQTIEVSSGLTAYCDVTRGASGLVTLDFATPPAADAIRVLMIKIG